MSEENGVELPVDGISRVGPIEPARVNDAKAISSGPHSAEEEHRPNAEQEHLPNKDKPRWTDVAVVLFTLGLVLVGALQTRIFDKQWREMISGSADTHELAIAAKQQAKASEAQANEAKAQVEKLSESLHKTDLLIRQETAQARSTQILAANSKSSLKAAQDNSHLEERAWVGVQTEILSVYAAGKAVEAKINVSNTGKSPALRISYSANLSILKKGEKPAFVYDWQLNNWSGANPIAPQGGYQITVSENDRVLGQVLYDEEKARLDHQEDIVWVWGTIRYEDIFNNEHTTRYCGYTLDATTEQPVTQGEMLKSCPEYSDMN